MEFVYEEERIECKKISVGEVDSEKIHEEGNVHHSKKKRIIVHK